MIHRRKGATLAEICIVLAVVSIISLMVVSFVTMTSGRSAVSAAKLNAMEELELVESLVDNWFDAMMKNGGQVELNGVLTDNAIKISDDAKVIRGDIDDSCIWMENLSELKVRLPGEENETVYPLKTVKGLRFAQVPTADEEDEDEENQGDEEIPQEEKKTKDILYFCTVEYTYRTNGREVTQYYTFCVNPRVGEVITPPGV